MRTDFRAIGTAEGEVRPPSINLSAHALWHRAICIALQQRTRVAKWPNGVQPVVDWRQFCRSNRKVQYKGCWLPAQAEAFFSSQRDVTGQSSATKEPSRRGERRSIGHWSCRAFSLYDSFHKPMHGSPSVIFLLAHDGRSRNSWMTCCNPCQLLTWKEDVKEQRGCYAKTVRPWHAQLKCFSKELTSHRNDKS
jgi:hypothetical protein